MFLSFANILFELSLRVGAVDVKAQLNRLLVDYLIMDNEHLPSIRLAALAPFAHNFPAKMYFSAAVMVTAQDFPTVLVLFDLCFLADDSYQSLSVLRSASLSR